MSEADRDSMRRRMLVLPTQVALRLEPVRGKIIPMFVCLSCESSVVPDEVASVLRWHEDKEWFECAHCGLELLPREADLLVVDGLDALRSLRMDVTGEKTNRWHWVAFLSRLLRGHRRLSP